MKLPSLFFPLVFLFCLYAGVLDCNWHYSATPSLPPNKSRNCPSTSSGVRAARIVCHRPLTWMSLLSAILSQIEKV